MMKIISVIIIAVMIPSFCFAEVKGSASIAMPVLEIGAGARAAAMGEAFTAISDDTSASYWNPAGLGGVKRNTVTASFNSWLTGTFQQRIMYSMPLGPGGLGADVFYMNYGTFEEADFQGTPSGAKISPFDIAVNVSYGMQVIRYFRAGASVKVIDQSYGKTGSMGFAADLGMIYREGFLSLGASIRNMGIAGAYAMPFSVRGGVAYSFIPANGHGITLASDASFGVSGVPSISAGLEYAYGGLLAIRGGYKIQLADDNLTGLKGLSAGAGFRISDFVLDYAFAPFGELGASHTMGLSFMFGETIQAAKPKVEKKATK